MGPLAFNPSLALTNGVDTNVFNELENPQQDFMAVFEPGIEAWLRLGRARVSATGGLDLIYFNEFSDQRAVNSEHVVRLELPVHRITPYLANSYINARERPSLEIDTRVRRFENSTTLGADVRLSSRAMMTVAARHFATSYDDEAAFEGRSLRQLLDRRASIVSASARYNLTPYTRFVVNLDSARDRFEFSPHRDTDSLAVAPGLEFDELALLSGRAFVGFRRFNVKRNDVPDFQGAIASVDLAYRRGTTTQFSIQVDRDVSYAAQVTEPYYVRTGVLGRITRRIGESFEVVASAGRQRLAYRAVLGEIAPVEPGPGGAPTSPRRDAVQTYSGGVGYHLGKTARLGIVVDYSRRLSSRLAREYEGLRFLSSVTYGF